MLIRELGWGRPLGYDRGVSIPFHAIVAVESGAFVTACRGMWQAINLYRRSVYFRPELDAGDFDERWVYYPRHTDEVPVHASDRCIACVLAIGADSRAVELERARRAGIELLKQSEVR